MPQRLDLDHLLRLRVVVARFGEMDGARWWNTKGQLGRLGSAALRRGFPRTHYFAQARSVFAVAGHRCKEIFDAPGAVTLWRLTEPLEEEFDAKWEQWLEQGSEWEPFFRGLQEQRGEDLTAALVEQALVTDAEVDSAHRLRRAAEGRAVPIPGVFEGSSTDIAILALGFGRGVPGELAVPYMQRAHS